MSLRKKIKKFLYIRKFSKKKYLADIKNKNILITGANSGIGFVLTKRLLELDNKILAVCRENS
jgi:FlaA1/EpsC-like NDP-sugar epimerase